MGEVKRSRVRRIGAAMCAIGLSVALLSSASLAQADSLTDQKNTVQTKINNNEKVITQAQAALAKAQAAVKTSAQALADAQADLAAKQQETREAQATDTQLAASLVTAQQTLAARQADVTAANQAVADGEAALETQRNNIGLAAQAAVQQNTTLLTVAILFTNTDTSDINNRLQWAKAAFAASQNAMDQLQAAQAKLEAAQANAQQAALDAQTAAADVQTQKDAAAAHLSVTKQAQAAAQQAKDNVATQQAANQKAQSDAQKALDAANAEQKQLQSDMNNILAQIQAQLKASSGTSTTNKAAPTSGSFFYRPVPGRVTSPYGWRINPITHKPEMHPGVDFSAACGTPIHAAEAGTVTMAGWNGGYGNYVLINHGKIAGANWSTGYGHQSKIAVKVGEHVTRGEVIGYVGTTGLSTGCHVHFNVFKNGATVDGLPLVS